MNCLAWQSDPKRSGNSGPYFKVLNNDSEYGLSLDTRGRECDRVTSRSASSAATVLLVIDVPRSACTTRGTPASRCLRHSLINDEYNPSPQIRTTVAVFTGLLVG